MACRQEVTRCSMQVWLWLRRRLRVVRVPLRTYADLNFDMAKRTRQADFQSLLTMPGSFFQKAWMGNDMLRVKRYWKLPAPISLQDLRSKLRASAVEAVGPLLRPLCRDGQQSIQSIRKRVTKEARVRKVLPDPAYEQYVYPMTIRVGDGHQFVIEDKDPGSAWLVGCSHHNARLLAILAAEPQWWIPTSMTYAAAVGDIRSQVTRYADSCRLPFRPRKSWDVCVPYMYASIKSKCFRCMVENDEVRGYGQFGSHTCTRRAHGCYRKIVSWWRFPYRSWIRRMGKGIRLLMMLLQWGSQVRSLKDSVADMHAMFFCMPRAMLDARGGDAPDVAVHARPQ